MRVQLNEAYLGFPAGTIIETTSLVNDPQFMGKVTVLDASDNSSIEDAIGRRALIVTGATKTSMPAGFYAYGLTCWVDQSKITSCEKTIGSTASADTDESVVGVPIPQGQWFPFINKVTSVTQTNTADVIVYWLKKV